MTDYDAFLKTKRVLVAPVGKEVKVEDVNPMLFEHQRALVVWACKKGCAAIFADAGLGKTFMQVEVARLLAVKTLIIAPLSVCQQTIREAAKLGVTVVYSREGKAEGQITITNYEMAAKFKAKDFELVILDESSILKGLGSKTRRALTEQWEHTKYKLCCTATPAPNDLDELLNHSEFLSIMDRKDALATWFVHSKQAARGGASSTGGYTLKSHARRPFFRWLASWGISMRKPSDLGFDDAGYDLPELTITPHWIDFEYVPEGQLFNTGLKGVTDRAKVRKGTLEARVKFAADMINASTENWIVWTDLLAEDDALAAAIPDAKVITGSMSPDQKVELLEAFIRGEYRVMITKASIAGFGVNLQNCARQFFVGFNDSYEQFYQAVRRSHRFGQTKPVEVHIVLSHVQQPIYQNVMDKQAQARALAEELIREVQADQLDELRGADQGFVYNTDTVETEQYKLLHGDSCERLKEVPDNSVDLVIYSPPFSSIYSYSPSERDLSNSRGMDEFFQHYRFIMDETLRVLKPGRNACVHCMQLPATLSYHGFIGMIDFRGAIIREMTARGWHYYGEFQIQKDPQQQAIRTKKRNLLFVTLARDATQLAPGIADTVLIFKKPGANAVPVKPIVNGQMTEEDWIKWAHPIWTDIKTTDVLNTAVAKDNPDEKHIAPLQLEVIRRLVRLYSNKGETVLDPFGGIGSTPYVAVQEERKAVACELKPSYFRTMVENLKNANARTRDLFSLVTEEAAAPAPIPAPVALVEEKPAEAAPAKKKSQRSINIQEDRGKYRIKVIGPIAHHHPDGHEELVYRCVLKVATAKGGFKEIDKRLVDTAEEAEEWRQVAMMHAQEEAEKTAGEKAA